MWPHPERNPGDVLQRRFLDPLGLSPEDLARDTGLSQVEVDGLLRGDLPITPSIALRLARWLRMEPEFWIGLQGEWDLTRCDDPAVTPARTAGFLVGPEGAVPIPPARRSAPDFRVGP